MSSSKSRSVSVEIVPPTGPRPMDRVGVIKGALANNGTDADRDDDYDHDIPERGQRQAPSAPPKPTASPTTGNAPTPCERCVRTNRVCKGVSGVRCEYCKRLKQRCTNSSGPARGKNAAEKKVAEHPVGPSSKPPALSGPSTTSSNKRKQPDRPLALPNGDIDGVSLDGEGSLLDDDDQQLPPRFNKKRRISFGNKGPSRSELQKVVSDLDASVKRIQTSVAREVDKVNATIKSLNAKISEMESD